MTAAMAKLPYFLGLGVACGLPFLAAGCGGNNQEARSASEVGSPQKEAPAEPDLVATVVGTIGRDHLTTEGYPLTRIADIIDVFKPDMLLLQVRPDAYKQLKLEDASFEMTYVNGVAGTAGVDTEPFDWFRDEDVMPAAAFGPEDSPSAKKEKKGGKPQPVSVTSLKSAIPPDPFNFLRAPEIDPDMMDAYKTESAPLDTLGFLSFTDANNDDQSLKIWNAMSARIRYTTGYSALARRLAWMEFNATQAFMKQKGSIHRLMVVANVRYRSALEQMVAGYGAVVRDPVAIQKKTDQAHDSVPDSVVAEWRREIDRLRDGIPKHAPDALRKIYLEKIAILQAAVDKKGSCCVDSAAFVPKDL